MMDMKVATVKTKAGEEAEVKAILGVGPRKIYQCYLTESSQDSKTPCFIINVIS